jgi:hypothetical protein
LILVALAFVNERVSAGPLGEAQKLSMAANAQANNNLRNAEVIEAMGMLPAIRGRWFKLHRKFLEQQALASDRAGMLTALTRFARISTAIPDAGLWRAAGDRRRNHAGNDDRRVDSGRPRTGAGRSADRQLETAGVGTRRLQAL